MPCYVHTLNTRPPCTPGTTRRRPCLPRHCSSSPALRPSSARGLRQLMRRPSASPDYHRRKSAPHSGPASNVRALLHLPARTSLAPLPRAYEPRSTPGGRAAAPHTIRCLLPAPLCTPARRMETGQHTVQSAAPGA
ncbi:hypothetical protein B0H19DRAFT_1148374 [Mycena capillaripes]|nr:hypothetical protein B0H19DRAFT_1148374 [Mycena capillaripes]